MKSDSQDTTFHWPSPERSSWVLAGLIFAMLFLHSAAFLLFQAATPVINPPPRTAPPIQLLTPYTTDGRFSSENDALLRWIAAEDPAQVAKIPNVDLLHDVSVPYRPSYSEPRTAPLALPPEPVTVLFPPARDSMSVIQSGMPPVITSSPELKTQPTRIQFSSGLAPRAPKDLEFRPAQRTSKVIEPSTFLIGVAGDGDVHFVFPQVQDAASEPALDDEAAEFLKNLRFGEKPLAPITWGSAIVIWGDDVAVRP